ncbi:MAG: hypothetical protein KGR23_06025 [Betaproteobacteria bacterium]|nr:hypothetical protein [Betaproteobacteria bacterium]
MHAIGGRREAPRWWWWGLAMLVALSGRAAMATDAGHYPSHPVHLIVPFGPGSGGDFLARLVGARLARDLGEPVVVENRPGAAGNIAMNIVARADPDGYTLVLGNAGTNTVNPSLYRRPGFDPIRSFVPITKLTTVPSVIVAGPSSPVHTLAQLIELARREPGQLDYETLGLGLSSHLAMVEVAEQGFPGFDMQSWYGVLAPHGTPSRIVDRLNADLVRIVHEPDIAKAIVDAGQQVVGDTTDEFAADIRAGLARGRKLVDQLGIHVD